MASVFGFRKGNGSGQPTAPSFPEDDSQLVAAASNRDLNAAKQLYFMYNHPDYVHRSDYRAFFWLRFCAELDDANSCILVGDQYFSGSDMVTQNPRTAFKFYEKANRLCHPEAQQRMQLVYNELIPIFGGSPFIQSLRDAEEYDPIRTEDLINAFTALYHGDESQCQAIGLQYANGQGVRRDPFMAFYFYDRLSKTNRQAACPYMARLYGMGLGVEMDGARAVSLYEESGFQYPPYIKNNLSLSASAVEERYDDTAFYYYAPALYWCKLGVRKGSPYLYAKYGIMQASDLFGEQNLDEAQFYMAMALVCGHGDPRLDITFTYLLNMMARRGCWNDRFLSYVYREARRLYPDYYDRDVDYPTYYDWEHNELAPTKGAGWYVENNLRGTIFAYEPDVAKNNCAHVEDVNLAPMYTARIGMVGGYGPGWNIERTMQEYMKIPHENLRKKLINAAICEEWDKLITGAEYPASAEMAQVLLNHAVRYDYATYKQTLIDILEENNANASQAVAQAEANEGENRKIIRAHQSSPAPSDIFMVMLDDAGNETKVTADSSTGIFSKTDEKLELCEKYGNWEGEPEAEAANLSGNRDPLFIELQDLINQNNTDALIRRVLELHCNISDGELSGEECLTMYKYASAFSKEAVMRNHPFALFFLLFDLMCPYQDDVSVMNYDLCSRILSACEAMLENAGDGEFDTTFRESLAEMRKELEYNISFYEEQSRVPALRAHAYASEKEHDTFEEWLLYEEFKYTAETHAADCGCPIPFRASHPHKYAKSRVDWEELLSRPWAEYWQNFDFDTLTDTGIPLKDLLSSVLKPGEEKKSQLPENLDSYFEGMIGMEPVKAQLDKIYQSVKLQILREQILREKGEDPGLSAKGYNFILLGNPGTGKTTVARIIAKILFDIGIRSSDSFSEVERSKIISDHVGGTEKRIRGILDQIQGGTLFIDEAYALYREDSDNDFGQEAIDVLMKDMEDNRNSYSVIIAGYREPMLNMIKNANSGFSSRFTYQIELPDYSDDALIEMAHVEMAKQKFTAEAGVDDAIRKAIRHDKIDQTFGNARYIRELVNRAIENQSHRLHEASLFQPDDLFILKPVDFFADVSEQKSVKEYLDELNALTGLASVKEEVNSLISMITVQKEMEKRGMGVAKGMGTLHMAFKGNPGTGKTTVARIIGKIYTALGILKRGDVFVECSRSDLVAEYQGQTAVKVKKVVQSAMGGILFVDEAYSLVQSEHDTFGHEAVDMLVSEMENNRDNLVVIFAGYSHDIDKFFENNQGLRSRVPKDLLFEDYSLQELFDIAMGMFRSKQLSCTPAAEEAFRLRLLQETACNPNFGNARGVRNLIDSVVRRQNVRIAKIMMDNGTIDDSVMLTIEEDDVQK